MAAGSDVRRTWYPVWAPQLHSLPPQARSLASRVLQPCICGTHAVRLTRWSRALEQAHGQHLHVTNARRAAAVSEARRLRTPSPCGVEVTENYLLNKWKNGARRQNVCFICGFILFTYQMLKV